MQVESLKDHLVRYKDELITFIRKRKYRPKRNAHLALRKCQDYITKGYLYAVDLGLERFFDTVSHSKLIEVLCRKVKDGWVVSLIHKYLNAGLKRRMRAFHREVR